MITYHSDALGSNTNWNDSGLRNGDQMIVEVNGETSTFTMDTDFLNKMIHNRVSSSYIIEAQGTNHHLQPYQYSSTAENFIEQIQPGANVSVKLKDQQGNLTNGITIQVTN